MCTRCVADGAASTAVVLRAAGPRSLRLVGLVQLAAVQRLAEHAHRFARRRVDHHLAVVEHDRAVADAAHEVGGVGDEEDRAALLLELLDPLDALALERLVADREHLVDEKDVGVDVHRDREPSRTYMPDE